MFETHKRKVTIFQVGYSARQQGPRIMSSVDEIPAQNGETSMDIFLWRHLPLSSWQRPMICRGYLQPEIRRCIDAQELKVVYSALSLE